MLIFATVGIKGKKNVKTHFSSLKSEEEAGLLQAIFILPASLKDANKLELCLPSLAFLFLGDTVKFLRLLVLYSSFAFKLDYNTKQMGGAKAYCWTARRGCLMGHASV